jgi:hypothetical protein
MAHGSCMLGPFHTTARHGTALVRVCGTPFTVCDLVNIYLKDLRRVAWHDKQVLLVPCANGQFVQRTQLGVLPNCRSKCGMRSCLLLLSAFIVHLGET